MCVYFVFRGEYNYNRWLDKQVRRFDDDSVVAWAKRVWGPVEDDRTFDHGKALLGGLEVESFDKLFSTENALPGPPKKMSDVVAWFQQMYHAINAGTHHLQLHFVDESFDARGLQVAICLFDDHYRAANPGNADFLLHDGWELPTGDADEPAATLHRTFPLQPAGDGEGVLYPITPYMADSYNTPVMGESTGRIDGMRVDGLCRYLLMHPDANGQSAGMYCIRKSLQELLASPTGKEKGFLLALRENPADPTNWNAYTDWLYEHDKPAAGLYLLERAMRGAVPCDSRNNRNPAQDLVQVTPHLAQARKHEDAWSDRGFARPTPHESYETWIFFDDIWVAAHPTLAKGMIRFATQWDLL